MKKKAVLLLAVLMILSIVAAACSAPAGTAASTAPSAAASAAPSAAGTEAAVDPAAPSASADFSNLPAFDDWPRPKMSADGKTLNIAYLHGALDTDHTKRLYTQMHIEESNRGWKVQYIDVSEGEEAIQTGWNTAINMGVDSIVLDEMENVSNRREMIEKTRNAGISVYSLDCGSAPGMIAHFTTPMGVAAMQLFYEVGGIMGWKGNFCISTARTYASVWERTLGVESYLKDGINWPEMHLLDSQSVDFSSPLAPPEQCFQFMKTWNQKYGMEMNAVFAAADPDSLVMNEAAVSAGRTPDNLTMFTIGGSPDVIHDMRDESCVVKYNYAMPYELFIHDMCELMSQIQIEGLTPGDGQCMIDRTGGTVNLPGSIMTKSLLPEAGKPIYTAYDYYDPNDTDAWYFWQAPGGTEAYAWK